MLGEIHKELSGSYARPTEITMHREIRYATGLPWHRLFAAEKDSQVALKIN